MIIIIFIDMIAIIRVAANTVPYDKQCWILTSLQSHRVTSCQQTLLHKKLLYWNKHCYTKCFYTGTNIVIQNASILEQTLLYKMLLYWNKYYIKSFHTGANSKSSESHMKSWQRFWTQHNEQQQVNRNVKDIYQYLHLTYLQLQEVLSNQLLQIRSNIPCEPLLRYTCST